MVEKGEALDGSRESVDADPAKPGDAPGSGMRGAAVPAHEGERFGSGGIGSAKRDATWAEAAAPSGSKVMSSSVSVPPRVEPSATEPSSSSSKATAKESDVFSIAPPLTPHDATSALFVCAPEPRSEVSETTPGTGRRRHGQHVVRQP